MFAPSWIHPPIVITEKQVRVAHEVSLSRPSRFGEVWVPTPNTIRWLDLCAMRAAGRNEANAETAKQASITPASVAGSCTPNSCWICKS